MGEPPSHDQLRNEICSRLEALEVHLPARIDPIEVSLSKLPFKALAYRETLFWRMAELSRAALENFEADRYAAAILLTRAAVETGAAMWFLWNKLTKVIEEKAFGSIDADLMRLSMGTASWDRSPQPINVMNFVDCVEKNINGFREQYGILSECAHPNYAGTMGLYATNDTENILTDFGPTKSLTGEFGRNTKTIGLLSLSSVLMMFPAMYQNVGDVLPEFVKLCEDALSQKW
jgi:hypothetical protein